MNLNRHPDARPTRWHWMALCLVIVLVIGVRIRLLNLPLERDEGEFAYVGQLMLEGIAPYKTAYVIKLPGTAAAYALSMAVFGQTAAGVHMGLLVANVTAILLVFFLAKRWFGASVGSIAAIIYALMSLSWGVAGNAAHATQFVITAALGGILLLLRSLESGRAGALFGSGILFGLAFLFKQPGIFFGAFGGLVLLVAEFQARPVKWMVCFKKAILFSLGIILPFALLCLILWRAGVFETFWHWSFAVAGGGWYSGEYARVMLDHFLQWTIQSHQLPFWCLAGVALPFVFWMRSARLARGPFLGFCATSILAVSFGFIFNRHYFVLALPAVGMLIGLGVVEARQRIADSQTFAIASFSPVLILALVCGWRVFADRFYLFQGTPNQLTSIIYYGNPFSEAVEVGDYIRSHSAPDSQIAVLGSEPEICFYAHRHSATGHLSTYILMKGRAYSHEMQEQMIREIEAAAPEFIVFINIDLSWLAPLQAADWTVRNTMTQYVKSGYALVGELREGPLGQPVFYWDAAVKNHPPNQPPYIAVYQRQKPLNRPAGGRSTP